LEVDGGTAIFTNVVESLGDSLVVAGTADFSQAQFNTTLISMATVEIRQGALLLDGDLEITDHLVMSGRLQGTGRTIVLDGPSDLDLQLGGRGDFRLDGRTIENWGQGTWIGRMFAFNDPVIESYGRFEMNGSISQWTTGTSWAEFRNAGELVQQGADSRFSPVIFTNSGTVDVQSGSLQLQLKADETSTGTFSAAAGASLSLLGSGGGHTLPEPLAISGAMTVGNVTLLGTFDVAERTVVAGGTTNFYGPVTSVGDSLEVDGGTAIFTNVVESLGDSLVVAGTADFSQAQFNTTLISMATVEITQGALLLDGDLEITDHLVMSGRLQGTGRTIVLDGPSDLDLQLGRNQAITEGFRGRFWLVPLGA
jgi:hypothetical protein